MCPGSFWLNISDRVVPTFNRSIGTWFIIHRLYRARPFWSITNRHSGFSTKPNNIVYYEESIDRCRVSHRFFWRVVGESFGLVRWRQLLELVNEQFAVMWNRIYLTDTDTSMTCCLHTISLYTMLVSFSNTLLSKDPFKRTKLQLLRQLVNPLSPLVPH